MGGVLLRSRGVRLVGSLCISIRDWGFPFEFRGAPFGFRGVSIPNSEGNGGLCVCGFSIGLALLIGAKILRDTKEKKSRN